MAPEEIAELKLRIVTLEKEIVVLMAEATAAERLYLLAVEKLSEAKEFSENLMIEMKRTI